MGLHFGITLGHKKIAYCYIRKNACSAFKKLFVDCSPFKENYDEKENPIYFMMRYHQIRSLSELTGFDHKVVVIRDPFERLVSIFLKDFVLGGGCGAVSRDYRRATGRPGIEASFASFVGEYLQQDFSQLDPHVLPQSCHLLPVSYTDAILLECLEEGLRQVLGPEIAGRYFGRKVNQTSNIPTHFRQDAPDVPALRLLREFEEIGRLPSKESFHSNTLSKKIGSLYRDDLKVFQNAAMFCRRNPENHGRFVLTVNARWGA